MKQIDKFINKYGFSFDPLIFQFDGQSYIPHHHTDGSVSYHQISSTEKERTVTELNQMSNQLC